MIQISSTFYSGNAEVLSLDDPRNIRLAIRPDVGDQHLQWFHFQLTGARAQPVRWKLTNASRASYPKGWADYAACASYDHDYWFRVPTSYEGGELVASHRPEYDVVWYAYFAPFGEEQHRRLLARSQRAGARVESLGLTVDGRALELMTFGASSGPAVWIIARQHPGETMAEFLVEGLVDRLLSADPLAQQLMARARFFVVPNMNPDGSARGHLRTNAAGVNLNRAWADPDPTSAPEVYLVRERMDCEGVQLCLDVHGDEALPYNFIAGADGVANLPASMHVLRAQYEQALERACAAFQRVHGYPRAALGDANMTMATNQLAGRFGALSMTLEQPFKDDANHPDPEVGWSPDRCRALGRAQVDALAAVVDRLR